MTGGAIYRLKVRLYTTQASAGTVRPTVTVQIHYSMDADPSIVSTVSQSLNQTETNHYNTMN